MGRAVPVLAALTAAVLVAIGVSIVPTSEPAQAAFPGKNGKIVSAYTDYGASQVTTDLYIVNPDGTGWMRLSGQPENANNDDAAWSPDGNKLAFSSSVSGGASDIYVMEPDGSALTQLTDGPARDGQPAWSPDGTKIAFVSNRDGNSEIYAMDADGSDKTNLTEDPAHEDSFPAWSDTPNGERIAFNKGGGLYLMDPDGSEQARLVPAPGDSVDPAFRGALSPAWSPEGTRLAYDYTEYFEGEDWARDEIRCVSLTSEECTVSAQTSDFEGTPAWSPDATQLLFVRSAEYDDGSILRKDLSAIGGQPVFLAGGRNPDWQPLTASTHPGTLLDSGPSGTVNDISATFAFTPFLEEGASLECSLDGAPFAGCASPKSYENLKAGEHTFQVRAVGANGVADPTPAERTWTVTPTETGIGSGPAGYVSEKSATLTFSATRTPATFRCSLDGSVFRSCASPKTYADLSDGRHTFRVKATDSAGNSDPTAAVRSWTVDTAAPKITDPHPAAGTTIKDRTPTMGAKVRDAQLDLAKENIKLFVDGRQILAFGYNRDTDRLSYTPASKLSYGQHAVRIRAKDAVNLATFKSWNFKVVR